MAHADDLLADIAARVESEHNSRMSLTVVIPGAVITGRLAPETLWKQRVAEVLEASDQLAVFSTVFTRPDGTGKPPSHGRTGPPTCTSTSHGSFRATSASPTPVACTGSPWRT